MKKVIVLMLLASVMACNQAHASFFLTKWATWVAGKTGSVVKTNGKMSKISKYSISPVIHYQDNVLKFFQSGEIRHVSKERHWNTSEVNLIYENYSLMRRIIKDSYGEGLSKCSKKCIFDMQRYPKTDPETFAILASLKYLQHKKNILSEKDSNAYNDYFFSLLRMMPRCPTNSKRDIQEEKPTFPRHPCD